MAIGAGISSTLGIATDATVLVPTAVTRFTEFDQEGMQTQKHTYQGQGNRGGVLYRFRSRRGYVGREVQGDIGFDVPTSGFGLWLQHMLGSFSATATSIGGGLFRQFHNTGSLQGKSFTMQIVNPDTTGVLTQEAFTYIGCKITAWELSVAQGQQAKVKISIDAIDEATPSNGVASTTLSSLTTAGATTMSLVATANSNSYVQVGIGATAEIVQIGTVTGAGPFTAPIVTTGGLKLAHTAGEYVGSATNVNYGATTALQASSYGTQVGTFDFGSGTIVAGGSTAVVSNLFTNTGGRPVANVRSISIKQVNNFKQDRWGFGSQVRSELIENNYRDLTATLEIEYNGRDFYDAFIADIPLALVFSMTTRAGGVLSFYMPVGFPENGAGPDVNGPDIIIQKLTLTGLDDGINGALQAVYTGPDATV